nr:CDP-glycerol glycerophosphotransferase family protein [Frondihabitans sp. VKM Ac-2883]
MDRDTDANDNGEHMYRHVWKNHPEVNSWFVLRRDSKDWARLEAEGFRLVDYGSFEWRLLILQADHLASSHIADYVVKPLPQSVFGAPRFYFTFLQHGVINYDLSRWLNSKRPDLFVVSTPQEKAAIGGHGPYFFTQKEVVLTGLPRFDSLLSKRASLSDDERDLIVIMPTWRQYLVGPPIPGSGRWARNPDFAASTFAKKYTELLTSKRIRDLAARTGKKIAFMPHPLLGEYLDEFVLPSDVVVLDFAVDGVQDVLARAAAFVTDYSSLGFEAGLLDIPLVYFHFDFSQFFSGSHSGRQGYFNYERDGFGPVVETVDGMYSALSGIADRQYRSEDTYVARTAATFPVRDGQSAERVLGAMKALEGSPRIVEPAV